MVKYVCSAASTEVDSQGERVSREFLEQLAQTMPARAPIHQEHDMSLPVLGYISNPRVEPVPDAPGEWRLVVDIDSETALPPEARAISWSATIPIDVNRGSQKAAIFLPFPLYNDEALVQSCLALNQEILVGKWVKKAADPALIALFTEAANNLLIGIAGSLLADAARTQLAPWLVAFLPKAEELWARHKTVTDFRRVVSLEDGAKLFVHMCPDRRDPTGAYDAGVLGAGTALAINTATSQPHGPNGPIIEVFLRFDRRTNAFVVDKHKHSDGTVVHHVPN